MVDLRPEWFRIKELEQQVVELQIKVMLLESRVHALELEREERERLLAETAKGDS